MRSAYYALIFTACLAQGQVLDSVVCTLKEMQTPGTMKCFVVLDAPAQANTVIGVSPSVRYLSMPKTATVLPGDTAACFDVTAQSLSADVMASVVGYAGGKSAIHRVKLLAYKAVPIIIQPVPVEPPAEIIIDEPPPEIVEPPAPDPEPEPLPPPVAQTPQAFRYVAIADPHFFSVTRYPRFFDHLRNMIAKSKELGADFIVILGDIIGQEPEEPIYPELRDIIDNADLPVFVVRGNHETPKGFAKWFSDQPVTDADGNVIRDGWITHMQQRSIPIRYIRPSDYYLDWKGVRLMGVDYQTTLVADHEKKNGRSLHEGLTENLPDGTPIHVWRHIHPGFSLAGQGLEYPAVASHKVTGFFWGHTHGFGRYKMNGIPYFGSAVFHASQYYLIVDVDANGVTTTKYRSLDPAKDALLPQ